MYKYAIILALINLATCVEHTHKNYHFNPYKATDHHFSQAIPLSYHYLWPWHQLLKSALVFDLQESSSEPKIIPDPKEFKVQINLGKIPRQELTVKVKDGYVIVEQREIKLKRNMKEMSLSRYIARSFPLPLGVKQEEVTAEYTRSTGLLIISAPKHKLPPPPPEREVPIVYHMFDDSSTEKTDINEEIFKASSESPIEKSEEEAFYMHGSSTEKSESKDDIFKSSSESPIEKTGTEAFVTDRQVPIIFHIFNSSTEKSEIKEEIVKPSSESPVEKIETQTTTHVSKIKKKDLKSTTKTAKNNEVTKFRLDKNGLDYILLEAEE